MTVFHQYVKCTLNYILLQGLQLPQDLPGSLQQSHMHADQELIIGNCSNAGFADQSHDDTEEGDGLEEDFEGSTEESVEEEASCRGEQFFYAAAHRGMLGQGVLDA